MSHTDSAGITDEVVIELRDGNGVLKGDVKGPVAVYVQESGSSDAGDLSYRVVTREGGELLVTGDAEAAVAIAAEAAAGTGGTVLVERLETTTGPLPPAPADPEGDAE